VANIKALDIVNTPLGAIALVTEAGDGQCSITFLAETKRTGEKNAWWDEDELTWVDSIPRLLANAMAHPFGTNKRQGDENFPRPCGPAMKDITPQINLLEG
jgi:hypothetical protein